MPLHLHFADPPKPKPRMAPRPQPQASDLSVALATIEPPKWLGALQNAEPGTAFKTGLMVIGLMPSDLIIMLTVATNLAQHNSSFVSALPFLAATYWLLVR